MLSLLAGATFITARPDAALAHPIHMSVTEVRFIESRKTLELSVRVFANDFSAAAARYSRTRLGADSLILVIVNSDKQHIETGF